MTNRDIIIDSVSVCVKEKPRLMPRLLWLLVWRWCGHWVDALEVSNTVGWAPDIPDAPAGDEEA